MFVTTPNPPTPPPSLPSGAHLRLSILDQINGMPAVMNLKWSTWSSQQERRLAGWLSCWRCSSGGIAKWNSVFRFSPFVIRRSSRTWTRPRLKFSAPASVRGRLVHDCRLSDVEWRRKGKKSLNGKWAPAADLDSCSISGIVWLASGYTKLGYGQRMRTRWDSLAHLTLPTWHSLHSIPFFFSFRRNWWKTNQGRLSTALQKWVSPDLSITIA